MSLVAWLCIAVSSIAAQDIDYSFLPTRAEATDFQETTRYDEVIAFIDILASSSDRLYKTTFGYTSEGRALPLVVFGDVRGSSAEAVKASGRTRIFIQANIHAGEVCGKEAALMLLRSLAAGKRDSWSDSLVVLVAPIYNADGNERIALSNRPRQNGPIGGMGQRPSAEGYDLNRDHMKLDSPEARSLVGLIGAYDPHVIVDLHTTNGTVHGYHLTYSPPLNPNTPAGIDSFLRDNWLPAVTKQIKEKYGWHYYYYGNTPRRGTKAWYTFDHRPRFNNNYAGLRNRMAILSEAYAYATFEDRVLASYYFLEEILAYAHIHASKIRSIVDHADGKSIVGESMAVRAIPKKSEEPVDILLGRVKEEKHPFTGATIFNRLQETTVESMFEYGSFAASETETVPAAYLIPDTLSVVLDRLAAHGIEMNRVKSASNQKVERFAIDSTYIASREYQGHKAQTIWGTYDQIDAQLSTTLIKVDIDQPLGRLAFYLLEPRSDDGLLNWGLIEAEGPYYPVLRIPAPSPDSRP